MGARSTRTLRATASAGLATFVASAFHILGGGSAPGAVTIGLTLAAATLVCLALSAAQMTLWRLVVSVVTSQAVFHLLFQITGSASTLTGHDHSSAVALHVGPAMHEAGGMTVAHVIAAGLTIAVIAFGERSLRRVLHILGRFVLRAIGPSLPSPIMGPARSAACRGSAVHLLPSGRVVAHPTLRRGPPSFA